MSRMNARRADASPGLIGVSCMIRICEILNHMGSTHFTRAIVRTPGNNFAEGLTTAALGAPIYELALQQHKRYCDALRECGLELTTLPADLRHPDSTFVEDTAVLAAEVA